MAKEKVDQSKTADAFAFKISPKLVEQNILRSPGPNEGVAPVPTGRTRITLPAPHGKGFNENKAQLFVPDSAVEMSDEAAVVTIDNGARIRTSTTADESWRPASYLKPVVESRLGKSAILDAEKVVPSAPAGDAPDGPAGASNMNSEKNMDLADNNKDYSEYRERVAVDAVEFNDKPEMSFDDLENDVSDFDM